MLYFITNILMHTYVLYVRMLVYGLLLCNILQGVKCFKPAAFCCVSRRWLNAHPQSHCWDNSSFEGVSYCLQGIFINLLQEVQEEFWWIIGIVFSMSYYSLCNLYIPLFPEMVCKYILHCHQIPLSVIKSSSPFAAILLYTNRTS